MSVASPERSTALELAPSDVETSQPILARTIGLLGLGAAALGIAAVIANQSAPRWISEGVGYLLGTIGIAGLLIHAIRDGDIEFRRLYGGLSIVLLLTAVVLCLIPGSASATTETQMGYYLLPWGTVAGFLSLLFLIAFMGNETDEKIRDYGLYILLGAGASFVVLSVALGFAYPSSLLSTGIILSLLGVGYLSAFFAFAGTSDGPGYTVAQGLGILGGIVIVITLARVIAPTVLYDGATALKKPNQAYDLWKVGARVLLILGCFAGMFTIRIKDWPLWMRFSIAGAALGFAIVLIVGSFTSVINVAPENYLTPYGLILLAIGGLFLTISISVCSENALVVLTRRELSSYFFSPISYIVFFAMALVAAIGYYILVRSVFSARGGPLIEPIIQNYWALTMGAAFTVLFLVPAITMRSFSEEKRTGTLEVMLTAPISESVVVLSKFLGAWVFFLLTWVPAFLYLIAFRVEGGQPFDYRPLISYAIAMAVCGCSFISMGIFFSSLTKNQIVAAVLTSAAMFAMLLTVLRDVITTTIGGGMKNFLAKLDFFTFWRTALEGQVPVPDVAVHLSLMVFWLFITVKVLEMRKWS